MGIDAVGRTGGERHIIFPVHHLQIGGLRRKNDFDHHHPVIKILSQNGKDKFISLVQFMQVGEQFRLRQPGMGRQHTMRGRTSDREGGPGQMSHAVLDNSLIDVMINRQIDLDLRDIEGAHHTGGKRVQSLLISCDFLSSHSLTFSL